MEINAYDLVELLKGEISYSCIREEHSRFALTSPRTQDIFAEVQWNETDWAFLEWAGNQDFFVYRCDNPDMDEWQTYSVDEILDIVL